MNLDYLRYFVILAELRHYTRAAAALCITQPLLPARRPPASPVYGG